MRIQIPLLLFAIVTSGLAAPREPITNVVEGALGSSAFSPGVTARDPSLNSIRGAWVYHADYEDWAAFTEATYLRLKAALLAQGWVVADGSKTASPAGNPAVLDMSGKRGEERLRLYVSLFPGPEKGSSYISYVQIQQ